ncbi:hypothetical protein [Acetobacterium sp.]|uniref:hypothetical protein n=1 Tax=Acetobacterium sp. TaxID=1872094 RepID=UPI002722D739|nr:hypothetical protein [Acetobacterium sp.]MDO9490714.1 hypothetical protein [Acetobacterium sp.]
MTSSGTTSIAKYAPEKALALSAVLAVLVFVGFNDEIEESLTIYGILYKELSPLRYAAATLLAVLFLFTLPVTIRALLGMSALQHDQVDLIIFGPFTRRVEFTNITRETGLTSKTTHAISTDSGKTYNLPVWMYRDKSSAIAQLNALFQPNSKTRK